MFIRIVRYVFLSTFAVCILLEGEARSTPCDNPILFVTQVPVPQDFATIGSTFANHNADMSSVFRGGDLYIRYPDGTLKNLTSAAGYGNSGFQGATSIAVRDPAVHWSGTKALFSMVIGSPTQQYQLNDFYWQLYEITGLGASDTPQITKVPNQPSSYNNIMGTYGTDGRIIFSSDRPRNGAIHLYPQLDEYESQSTNTGLWSLNPSIGELFLLDHAPSGAFHPNVDSYGRIVYTRWDHLQRDQQNLPSTPSFYAFSWESEDEDAATTTADIEIFPEPRSVLDAGYSSLINLHTINQFFPWVINEDGTEHETLNHIGRQELHGYLERSFNNDNSLQEFYGQYDSPNENTKIDNFFHIRESLQTRGLYFGIDAPEFSTHTAGQIITLTGAPGTSADDMQVTYITHRDTASYSSSPSSDHSGLYRTPFQCSNGDLVATHTSETREDTNIGGSTTPQSRYAFRIKRIVAGSPYYSAGSALTSGISKAVSWWSPDELLSYSGVLWELQPVEVVARTNPGAISATLPAPETSVFTDLGIEISELKNYLFDNNLALLVGRDVTTRDDLDKQQPFNLKVAGTNKQTVGTGGQVYSVSDLQIFVGEQIRGYGSNSAPTTPRIPGRRILPKVYSSIGDYNPENPGGPEASVPVAADGSWAAFVPARRALSWQLTDSDGTPVVRERYWVTFGRGEIRSCASCHGVNKLDQAHNEAPENQPIALRKLLEHWKNSPPSGDSYKIVLAGSKKTKTKNSSKLSFKVSGLKPSTYNSSITIKFKVNGTDCGGDGASVELNSSGTGKTATKKPPKGKGAKSITAMIYADGVQRYQRSFDIEKRFRTGNATKLCKALNSL